MPCLLPIRATIQYTTEGTPHGYTSLTPFITVTGAVEATEFYRVVFNARLVNATEIEGVIVHAELDFGNGRLQLGEPNPAYGLVPSPDGDTDCYSIGIYRSNTDATLELAIAAGSTLREPLTTFPSGDRFAVPATASP